MKSHSPASRSTAFALGFWAALILVVFSQRIQAENWPAWRGPREDGVSTETGLPTTWSKTKNVRWRVDLPERGNSTPTVWGDRIFVTQALEKKGRRTLMCFNRANGKVLWTSGVAYTEEEPHHKSNTFCAASPVTDGERVIVWFGSAGLYCYDLDGKELWYQKLGKQDHMWGEGTSPILYGDLCILSFGPGTREFIIAVDKKTGKKVWQVDALNTPDELELRIPGTEGNVDDRGIDGPGKSRAKITRGSFGTPRVVKAGGRDELIVCLPWRVFALDPKTGTNLWTCRGYGPLSYASPVIGNGIVVALGGWHGASLGVKLGGAGDVTKTHRLWQTKRTKQSRLGSGVVVREHLYVNDITGKFHCIELKTGKIVWEETLKATGKKKSSWSSPVLSEGNIYLLNQSGDTHVFKASEKFELVATNSLGETTNSSIAVSNGDLFIRTHQSLWCIGNPKK